MFSARTSQILLTTAGLLAAWPAAAHADPVLVSRASGAAGAPANALASHEIPVQVDVSRTGRFVAFTSDATNLIPGGLPSGSGGVQVYLRDLALGTTELVSRASGPGGAPSSGRASNPTVSDDGRFVAFEALSAANLAPATATDGRRVYIRDLETGTTTKVRDDTSDNNPGDAESWDPDLSGDGRTLAYTTTGFTWQSGAPTVVTTQTESEGDLRFVATPPAGWPSLPSQQPSISRDGRRVAYVDGSGHVIVTDLVGGTRTLVDQAEGAPGTPGNGTAREPAISADGFAVAFVSRATDLVPGPAGQPATDEVYLRRLGAAPRTELVSVAPGGTSTSRSGTFPAYPSVAENGDAVAFVAYGAGAPVSSSRLYVRQMSTGVTSELLPAAPAGAEGLASVLDAELTPDGTSVAFQSGQDNLSGEDLDPGVDAFLVAAAPLRVREPEGPRIPERRPQVEPPLATLAPGVLRRLIGLPSQRRVCRTTRLTLGFDGQIDPAVTAATVTVRWGERGVRTLRLTGRQLQQQARIGSRPRGRFTITVQVSGDGRTGTIQRTYGACRAR